jgi:hypothetical protein
MQGIVKYAKNSIIVLLAERTRSSSSRSKQKKTTYKKTLHA